MWPISCFIEFLFENEGNKKKTTKHIAHVTILWWKWSKIWHDTLLNIIKNFERPFRVIFCAVPDHRLPNHFRVDQRERPERYLAIVVQLRSKDWGCDNRNLNIQHTRVVRQCVCVCVYNKNLVSVLVKRQREIKRWQKFKYLFRHFFFILGWKFPQIFRCHLGMADLLPLDESS